MQNLLDICLKHLSKLCENDVKDVHVLEFPMK